MIIAVPARLESTRLPRKLLLNKTGKPLIMHTLERALEAKPTQVVLLADSQEIIDAVTPFGLPITAVLTPPAASGTERIAWWVQRECSFGRIFTEVIVNLQGDEPQLPARVITKVASGVQGLTQVATVATEASETESRSMSAVKVVRGKEGSAMFFSRAPIPYGGPWLRHIGIYAYTSEFLLNLPQAKPYAEENLEQLGWLWEGTEIAVLLDDVDSVGIDTQRDYERFVAQYERHEDLEIVPTLFGSGKCKTCSGTKSVVIGSVYGFSTEYGPCPDCSNQRAERAS
jgi:3-deoxy-manno-octulosonate cytidylyltransferase (CMP-KDO synthetase)